MKITDKYAGETSDLYIAYYATVDFGDGIRCAWCKKKDPSDLHLEIHDKITKIKKFFRRLFS